MIHILCVRSVFTESGRSIVTGDHPRIIIINFFSTPRFRQHFKGRSCGRELILKDLIAFLMTVNDKCNVSSEEFW